MYVSVTWGEKITRVLYTTQGYKYTYIYTGRNYTVDAT